MDQDLLNDLGSVARAAIDQESIRTWRTAINAVLLGCRDTFQEGVYTVGEAHAMINMTRNALHQIRDLARIDAVTDNVNVALAALDAMPTPT